MNSQQQSKCARNSLWKVQVSCPCDAIIFALILKELINIYDLKLTEKQGHCSFLFYYNTWLQQLSY